jgi:hypothetical protein
MRPRRRHDVGSATKARKHQRIAFAFFAFFVLFAVLALRSEAHKAITSKYTYNDDVFPILRERCSRCHVAGGVAPMSLMTYEEAFPWAESIRAELIAAHMPPWHADEAFGELKQAHTLTPRELDVILTWATGGNPRGALDQKLPAVTLKNEWTLGAPDLALPMPSEFAFAADKMEDTQEFTIQTGTKEARWVRAVDLLPGNPTVVRSAVVYLKGAGAAPGSDVAQPPSPSASASQAPLAETVLARWIPGQDSEPIGQNIAVRLSTGAELGLRIHYKKTWQFEGKPLTDRSTVGIYFAPTPTAQELLTLPVTSPALSASSGSDRVTFTQTVDQDVQALAVSADQVPPNITVQMEAVRPDGSRAPIIRLNTRADWNRRYWFERPLPLPRGSRIEVTATLRDPDLLSTAFAAPTATAAAPKPPTPFRLSLNVIPAQPKPAAP